MAASTVGEILPGLWRYEARHPEWTEAEGGEEGWEPVVAWWVIALSRGCVLVDPLVEEWAALDRLVEAAGGCAGIVRTVHWHQRSIEPAASRYGAQVLGRRPTHGQPPRPVDRAVAGGEQLFGALTAIDVERADELGLWLSGHRALVFGDAMLRTPGGRLRLCPESWTQPPGGHGRLRTIVAGLVELAPEHVLVSHGPLVLGDGLASLHAATE